MIWLMLLAVPVQGFAATSMASCDLIAATAPKQVSENVSVHVHDHQAMLAHHDHGSHASTIHQDGGTHHSENNCGGCAACCIGAAMIGSPRMVVNIFPVEALPLLVSFNFPASVSLSHPERPPQTLFV